jgi:hypothetical protein
VRFGNSHIYDELETGPDLVQELMASEDSRVERLPQAALDRLPQRLSFA